MDIKEFERYVGQTVTVFTASGGASGSGFTGVLIFADCRVIKLLCQMGMPPACPHNACFRVNDNRRYNGVNPLGSVVVIPVDTIVGFTHNAI